MHQEGSIGDPPDRLQREELTHRGFFRDTLSCIILAECVQDHMPQGIDIRRHLRQVALYGLALRDGLAKGDTLLGRFRIVKIGNATLDFEDIYSHIQGQKSIEDAGPAS